MLSNIIGGTATIIGKPPNIITGGLKLDVHPAPLSRW